MNTLIPRGVRVEKLNLPFIERVCDRYFRKVGQHWYLRGESVGTANGRSLIEERIRHNRRSHSDCLATADDWYDGSVLVGEIKAFDGCVRLAFCRQLSRRELSLDDILSENFWRDSDSNRWREPTDDEREKMNDDRSIRVLHDAERYVAGSLQRTTSDSERCEWIEVLFKACRQVEEGDMQSAPALRGFNAANAYRVITRLFQSILRERVTAEAYIRAQKQASVASSRISQSVRDEEELLKNERVKIKGPSLFDGVD